MKTSALFIATLLVGTMVFAATALAGCDSKEPSAEVATTQTSGASSTKTDNAPAAASTSSNSPSAAPTDATTKPQDTPKSQDTTKSKVTKEQFAELETSLGTIKLKFRPDVAPETVKNFVKLANEKFYDGTRFHRVIPGFMIQGGDPNSKEKDRSKMGMGGPGYMIKAEFNDLSHKRGVVSMARAQDPDSAGSQFFIVVSDSTFLDHQYTAFAEVVSGMDVADKIVNLKRDANDNPLEENPAIIKHVKITDK